MAEQNLGSLFSNGLTGTIEAKIDDALEPVTQPVSAGAFATKPLALDLGTPSVPIFGTPVNFTAKVSARADVLAANTAVSVFDDAPATAPPGTAYVQLDVNGAFGAKAAPAGTIGNVKLSGAASAAANFAYSHYLPAPLTDTRLAAFTKLVTSSQLPQFADASKFINGEILDFTALLNVDLGLTAQFGKSQDFSDIINLAQGLSTSITAHATFSINAALGVSLYDKIRVTLARAGQLNPSRVRVRVDRVNRRAITASAAFALAIDYDAATGLTLLIDQIFAKIPTPELVTQLETILPQVADWTTFTKTVEEKTASYITALLGDGWKQWAENSDDVKKFVAASNWIVNEYSHIDAKVRSIYEELLSRLDAAGLKHFRDLIHKVATFDINSFDVSKVASGDLKDILDLIEMLSGKNVEELLITGSVKDALMEAQTTAKTIDDLFTTAPDKAIEWINGFMQRTGITPVANWLQQNATSVASLEKAADSWISSIIEKLTGKLLSQISDQDVKNLQKFAAGVLKLINAPKDIATKLKTAVAKLKGTFGVSLTLEWSRVSEFAAVIDLEIDPTNTAAVKAVRDSLPSGNVEQLVNALAAIKPDNGGNLPYLVRDVIISSRHIRTSALSLLISWIGVFATSESTIDDTSITIRDGVRRGVYIGGATMKIKKSNSNAEGAAWLRHEASGKDNVPLDTDYDDVTTVLRLAYSCEYDSLTTEQIESINRLIGALGFMTNAAAPPLGSQTNFAVQIELSAAAAGAAFDTSNPSSWNVDMRNAGVAWLSDPMETEDRPANKINDMISVLKNNNFGQLWTHLGDVFNNAANAGDFGVVLVQQPPNQDFTFKPEYTPVQLFVRERPGRFNRFAGYAAPSSKSPAALSKSMATAARAFTTDGTEVIVPLLNMLYALARIARLAPGELQTARGLATFRSRANASSDWSDPILMTLPNGVPSTVKNLFPISG